MPISKYASDENYEAFIQAAQSGDITTLNRLLDAAVNVNFKAEWPNPEGQVWDGSPAIVAASGSGRVAVVKLLLEWGADIDNSYSMNSLP